LQGKILRASNRHSEFRPRMADQYRQFRLIASWSVVPAHQHCVRLSWANVEQVHPASLRRRTIWRCPASVSRVLRSHTGDETEAGNGKLASIQTTRRNIFTFGNAFQLNESRFRHLRAFQKNGGRQIVIAFTQAPAVA